MYTAEGKLFIEEDDQCNTCIHKTRGVSCPLLMALGLGVVEPVEDTIQVNNCGFYEEFKLKIVK